MSLGHSWSLRLSPIAATSRTSCFCLWRSRFLTFVTPAARCVCVFVYQSSRCLANSDSLLISWLLFHSEPVCLLLPVWPVVCLSVCPSACLPACLFFTFYLVDFLQHSNRDQMQSAFPSASRHSAVRWRVTARGASADEGNFAELVLGCQTEANKGPVFSGRWEHDLTSCSIL